MHETLFVMMLQSDVLMGPKVVACLKLLVVLLHYSIYAASD